MLKFLGIAEMLFRQNGGKNTWVIDPKTSAIFTVICATIFLYMGSQVWKARKEASDLGGVLKMQAMDNIRPKERALCLPGAGFLLGAIMLFAAI